MPDDRLSDREREELMDDNRLSDREAFDLLGAVAPNKIFYGPLKIKTQPAPSSAPSDPYENDVGELTKGMQTSFNQLTTAWSYIPPDVKSSVSSQFSSAYNQMNAVLQFLQQWATAHGQ